MTPQRILLSRLDRVGDLILSTPAIATLRRAFPAAHIAIVCSEYNAVVVENSPDVDEVACLPPFEAPHRFGARFRGADLAVALAPNASDMRLVAATRAPRRIGYTYERRHLTRLIARRWLTDCLISNADPDTCDRNPRMFVMHEVNQVLALAQRAGATEIVPDLRIVISDDDRAAVADFPPDPIIVHLGRRWMEHGSTTGSLLQLFRQLRPLGRPLVATYGADAVELAGAVRDAGVADRVAGGLTFGQWAAAFERAAAIVTIDTGATHVASAVRRPTIVLFEYAYFRLNSQEWSPYRVPNAVLRKPPTDAPAALEASRAEIVAAVARLL
ncbi:MAG TPA: glycosyltransferase family 9 protein [Candidatus Lustribacter sp.]|nr:glycosyltransferase family 9 protein [Candidatus Lustribacter sp.]